MLRLFDLNITDKLFFLAQQEVKNVVPFIGPSSKSFELIIHLFFLQNSKGNIPTFQSIIPHYQYYNIILTRVTITVGI